MVNPLASTWWKRARPTRRLAFAATAAIVGAAIAAFIPWWQYRQSSTAIASVHQLVTQFEAATFYSDFDVGKSSSYLRKRTAPILINLKGEVADEYKDTVKRYATELGRLAGLPVLVFHTSDNNGNILLHLVKRQKDMEVVFAPYFSDKEELARDIESSACMVTQLTNLDTNVINKTIIAIPTEYEPAEIRECILEELTQAVGPGHNTELIHPSVYSAEDTRDHQLTINDKIIVRTLNDERITPGMPRDEAVKMARTVISELVARVKAEGPEALYQPVRFPSASAPVRESVSPETVADVDLLVRQLDVLEFTPEFHADANDDYVVKWTHPVAVFPHGPLTAERKKIIDRDLQEIERLTGLPIQVVGKDAEQIDIAVRFPRLADFQQVLQEYPAGSSRKESIWRGDGCASYTRQSGVYTSAVVLVPIDTEQSTFSECALRALLRSFVTRNRSDLIHPSIFATEAPPIHQLAINDKIIVRALYDERIWSGMPRDAAVKMARTVISELVARVKADGPDALYQR